MELRKTLLDRAAGRCEHCHEELDAQVLQCDHFPCYNCKREISVRIGNTTDEPIDPYPHRPLPSIYYDFSQTRDGWYDMNHCSHCKAKIGNFFVEEFLLDNHDLFFGVEFVHHVHHVDFNPANNEPMNLLVVHPACHRTIHRSKGCSDTPA